MKKLNLLLVAVVSVAGVQTLKADTVAVKNMTNDSLFVAIYKAGGLFSAATPCSTAVTMIAANTQASLECSATGGAIVFTAKKADLTTAIASNGLPKNLNNDDHMFEYSKKDKVLAIYSVNKKGIPDSTSNFGYRCAPDSKDLRNKLQNAHY